MNLWNSYHGGFKAYLKFEKSLSQNSVEAYLHDVAKITQFFTMKGLTLSPAEVELHHLKAFLKWITELGVTARTQARVISGLRAFYHYLLLENIVTKDPTELIELPRIGMKLPVTLNVDEIDLLIGQST